MTIKRIEAEFTRGVVNSQGAVYENDDLGTPNSRLDWLVISIGHEMYERMGQPETLSIAIEVPDVESEQGTPYTPADLGQIDPETATEAEMQAWSGDDPYEPAYFPPHQPTKDAVRVDEPHSRACGALRHEHGVMCSDNCPTCGGNIG